MIVDENGNYVYPGDSNEASSSASGLAKVVDTVMKIPGVNTATYTALGLAGLLKQEIGNLRHDYGSNSGTGTGNGSPVNTFTGSNTVVNPENPISVEDEESGQQVFRSPILQGAKNIVDDTAMANNVWSAKQAQIQRDWQEYMSNTAVQRQVADMQAAGINPVLAASYGGASTPSGAMGQTDTSNTSFVGELALRAVDGLANTASGLAGAGANKEKASLLGKLDNLYSKSPVFRQIFNSGSRSAGTLLKWAAKT